MKTIEVRSEEFEKKAFIRRLFLYWLLFLLICLAGIISIVFVGSPLKDFFIVPGVQIVLAILGGLIIGSLIIAYIIHYITKPEPTIFICEGRCVVFPNILFGYLYAPIGENYSHSLLYAAENGHEEVVTALSAVEGIDVNLKGLLQAGF